jgi:DNA polymerase-3 subunit delta'
MTVWDDVVGQPALVRDLRRAVTAAQDRLAGGSGAGMTSAWLFTGPPGSGRSNAARAFAAALECEQGGCGTCNACRTSLTGSHPDVRLVHTDRLSLGVDDIRELVRSAALLPAMRRWQVLVVEDADRLTDAAGDALLKSLEEPPPRTVWMLCAPTAEDVLVTVRSRCRTLVLRTPTVAAIADVLERRDSVPPSMAAYAARASQGHIGRARALARDEATRNRRREVLSIPAVLRDLGACLIAAANLHEVATEEGEAVAAAMDSRELAELEQAWGAGERGTRSRGFTGALSSLRDDQKKRQKRVVRDSIDGALIDLLSFYRDVLVVQTGATVALVNAEAVTAIQQVARAGTPEQTLVHIEAVLACRAALVANAAPLLALEALMLSLAG